MAKVRSPLLSGHASGKVGDLVFDKRGYVRIHVIARNPKSAGQGNARQALIAAQKGVKACGPATREQLRAGSKVSYRWSSGLVKEIIGSARTNYLAGLAEYQTFSEAGLAEWEAAAVGLMIPPVDCAYATEGLMPPGAILFLLARALYGLGLYPVNGRPGEMNGRVWGEAAGM